MMEKKTIGEINGGFSIMFRIALATYPVALAIMVAFSTWVVTQLHELDKWRASTSSNRFTSNDWLQQRNIISEEFHIFDRRISALEEANRIVQNKVQATVDNSAANKSMLEVLIKQIGKQP